MRGILLGLAAVSAILLAILAAAQLAGVALLSDPLPLLRRYRHVAGLLSFGLLAADVVLPVPSSLIMIANGGLFGLVPGAMISTAASVASGAAGFWLGRRGRRLLGEDGRAKAWLGRWGGLAIAASRPVPLLAESVAIVAGATSLSWATLLWSSLVGSAPAALLYAYAGSRAGQPAGFVAVFLLTLLLAGALWWFGYRTRHSS